ncbi:hypothetical protein [Methylobacterium goesingense]|uniref:Uncharacterized protein n=1 Tax=Methylobacterium goesingense TaxID=243690 RepID=A0ABV2L309_9HYPH|nr:hypothetical protein [Methylobacterium goesingense]GJD72281.1 hypothetical protein CFIICLFH_0494 [Methylobacterium goesingense]
MVPFRTCRWGALLPVFLLLLLGAGPALSQAPEVEGPPETEAPAAPAPKPRPPKPKPKPKPAPKPKPSTEAPPAEVPPAEVPVRAAATPPEPVPEPKPAPAPMPAANLPGLTVQCEAKAALYEGPKDFAVWVTRTGALVVENPLRPLTPETTRVLQVVIGGKAATAYGPDLFALRRGGSPGSLEALLGGPIRWDAVPTALPDTLNIVSEAGQSLAQLAFQSCGEAPAVKAAPVAAKDKPAKAKSQQGAPGAKAAGPGGAKAPPGLSLPQGAIE